MLRVAPEVRIFPLLTLALELSPYLQPLLQELTTLGHLCEVRTVPYELQRNGNHMLCLKRKVGL